MKVAIQGISACFHEMAAAKYFGSSVEPVTCMTFHKLCEALHTEDATYAVMAIENTIAGSLLQNYALLMKYNFFVIGEVYLNIQMHLMSLPGQKIENLTSVQSHPIALSQCATFLWKYPQLNWVEVSDTAWGAKDIAEHKKTNVAAVANTLAAERYGLEILEKRIETHRQNFTRFLVLSKNKFLQKDANKASICLKLKHEKGSLSNVLTVFTVQNINLTKIQSVPILGKPYEYQFHIDIEWDSDGDYQKAIEIVRAEAAEVRLLGMYKKGNYEEI